MNVIFYRYGNICEPDIIANLSASGLTVIEETAEIHDKKLPPSKRIQLVDNLLQKHKPLFVFSINFYPGIAELCHIRKVLYLCWSVDCPVMELFAKPLQYPTNRVFLFDRAQYERFHPYNPDSIFYLPLAAATKRFDKVVASITEQDRSRYSADISFVGSLYSERNPLHKLNTLPEYVIGYIDGIVEASLKIYGCNFMEEALSSDFIADFKKAVPDFYSCSNPLADTDSYILAHKYLGYHVAETERIRTLNTLAEYFTVDLYTGSDTRVLNAVRTHGTIDSLSEMPKVFHLSKINLNMTIKPIQTGLPLRIFDIMGCGGFLMTNFQAELTDFFEIGVDLEAYSSMEELIEKCDFYLKHPDVREKIALQGYQTVTQFHTYPQRIAEMLRMAIS